MKKLIIIFVFFINTFVFVNAEYRDFKDSPNKNDLKDIKDLRLRYCEEVFLRAYMRREFSEIENKICRNIFARKIEAEIQYKKNVMSKRGI